MSCVRRWSAEEVLRPEIAPRLRLDGRQENVNGAMDMHIEREAKNQKIVRDHAGPKTEVSTRERMSNSSLPHSPFHTTHDNHKVRVRTA